MKLLKKLNKFSLDVVLNLFSSLIITLMLQAVLYPNLSRNISSDAFGELIYIMGLVSIISSTIGSAAVSLYFKKYNRENVYEDNANEFRRTIGKLYITLFISLVIFNAIFVTVSEQKHNIFIINIIIIFITLRIYLLAWYRSLLQYKLLFINNFFLAFGYFLSLLLTNTKINVFFLFLIPELIFFFIFLSIQRSSKLLVPKTRDCSNVHNVSTKSFLILLLSALLVTAFKYVDRIVINNFLSMDLVAVYYAGNITGQLFALPFSILSTVVFSYYIQKDYFSFKKTTVLVVSLPILSVIIYFIGLTIGPYILKFLYPNYFSDSLIIFYICNIGQSLLIIDYILRGFILKFFNEKHKLFVDIVPIVFFIAISFFIIEKHGLIGVAFAFSASVLIKCIVNYIYLIHYLIVNYKAEVKTFMKSRYKIKG